MPEAAERRAAEVKGVGLMIVGTAFLTWSDVIAKHLAERYPIGEIVCLRQTASLAFILIYVMATTGPAALAATNWSGQFVRGLAFLTTTVVIVMSLERLPIAVVTAIVFASPIWIALFSWPMLGERVSARRWLAILVGFAGMLAIIRPGGPTFEWVLLLPALASLASAFRDTLTRRLARTESSIAILFWSSVLVIIATALTAAWGWKPVTALDAGWLVLNGLLGAAAHFLMIRAYHFADAALVAPYRYTALVWALLSGMIVWSHVPDSWTILGSLVIVASGLIAIERSGRPAAPAGSPAGTR